MASASFASERDRVVIANGFFIDAAGTGFVSEAEQVEGALAKARFRGQDKSHGGVAPERFRQDSIRLQDVTHKTGLSNPQARVRRTERSRRGPGLLDSE